MVAASTTRSAARERLLAAADELFYAEGVRTVGIDRVIEHAGVAKATLYKTFGSKDELVRAYLGGRLESRRQRMEAGLARYDTPREKLLAIYEVQGERFAEPTYRGCAFINASAEAPPGGPVEEMATKTRTWLRTLVHDLTVDLGAPDPDALTAQLVLLYDGALIAAQLDRNTAAADTARTAAATLIDAALSPDPQR
jgi:AcrR family transcriptional regulator